MKKTLPMQLPEGLIKRDLKKEAKYGIQDMTFYTYRDYNSYYIVGQVFSGNGILKDFCLIMTIYDKDGDILDSTESHYYGRTFVTSMIKPFYFFDGFPFSFELDLEDTNLEEISWIDISPADSY